MKTYMLLEMDLSQERRQLVFLIKTAQTPEQIRSTKAAVKLWLEKWPEDAVIERAARELERSEAWLRKEGQWQ